MATIELPQTEIASMSLQVQCGALDDPVHQIGAAHLLEHVIAEMPFRHPRARPELAGLIKSGFDLEASTGFTSTTYETDCLAQQTKATLRELIRLVLRPSASPQHFATEKKVVSVESRTTPEEYESYQRLDLLFPGNPALLKTVTGDLVSIRALSMDDLMRVHERFYVSERMTLWIASPMTHDEVVSCVLASSIPSGGGQRPVAHTQRLAQGDLRYESVDVGAEILFNAPSVPRRKQRAVIAVENLLTDHSYGSIAQVLRRKLGQSYGINAAHEWMPLGSAAVIDLDTASPEAIDIALAAVNNLKRGRINPQHWNGYLSQLPLTDAIGRELMRTMRIQDADNLIEQVALDPDLTEDEQPLIPEPTRDEIVRMANELFASEPTILRRVLS
ncbi:insulinase family protein [Patescibacteria group bacterium]|nr:insulinase family protein [Patescibacteria group bacterium]